MTEYKKSKTVTEQEISADRTVDCVPSHFAAAQDGTENRYRKKTEQDHNAPMRADDQPMRWRSRKPVGQNDCQRGKGQANDQKKSPITDRVAGRQQCYHRDNVKS